MIPRLFVFPHKWMRALPCSMLAACLSSCASPQSRDVEAQSAPRPAAVARSEAKAIPVARATVVRKYPHDPNAFTQGLEFFEGHLYESTGRAGQSTLRECVLETGQVLRRVNLPPQEFGEGLTIFRGKIYQLTWLSRKGFLYDLHAFKKTGEFRYESEGWGLTHNDQSLIMSDGTNRLQFLDPVSFAVTGALEVSAGNEAVTNLNELEYLHGEIWANIWHSSRIARIDPHTGQVDSWIELAPLVSKEQRGPEDVLNGIAYDAKSDRLLVTGKDWPEILEIKLEDEKR